MTGTYARSMTRDLDIVLYGATGFVGKLTAEHLAQHAPEGTRIGLAGRSREKVERVRSEIGRPDWSVLQADSSDAASLRTLAESARVVITTVGPYAEHGLPLVIACADAGTDYVDLTGETLFVRESIDAAHEVAQRTGARIVHSCGYDSVPSDLTVMMAAERAADDGAGTLADSTQYATLKGGLSGGTIASMRGQVAAATRDPKAGKVIRDKFALSPERSAEPSGEYRDTAKVERVAEVRSWVAPFLMASYNTRVVRRSNALTGYRYGRDFRYREVMRTGDGAKGAALAYAVAGALGGALAAFAFGPAQPLLDKVLPGSGEGPSEQSRANGFFRMDLRTTTTTGARYRSVVEAQGDPGYAATAVMLGESALALALDDCPAGGGVLTPATALGPVLVQRLVARGFTCGTSRL